MTVALPIDDQNHLVRRNRGDSPYSNRVAGGIYG
jgi:hypothetical protein